MDEMLVQQDGEENPHRDLQDSADRRPKDRLAEDDPELGAPENQRVLTRSRDLPIPDAVDVGVGEREYDIVE